MENDLDSLTFTIYDGDNIVSSGTVPIRLMHLLTGNYLLKKNENFVLEVNYKGKTVRGSYWLPPEK